MAGAAREDPSAEASLEFFIGVAGELVRTDVAEQIALLKNLLDELKGEEARLRQLLLGKQTTEAIPVFRSVATTAHGIASAASDVARLLLCPLCEDG
jgi:hypothetical protein